MHTHTHTCIHPHTYKCTETHAYVHMNTPTYICIGTHIHTCTHIKLPALFWLHGGARSRSLLNYREVVVIEMGKARKVIL